MLNITYGYSPINASARFKQISGKKHPEYKMSGDAMSALNAIFKKMRFNQPIEQVKTDLAPLINYYEGLTKKYTGDKKQEKNVRSSALYNLAQIHYYTDQPEKCKEYAQQLIDLKLDKSNGKRFITKSDDLINQLKHHHMENRHIMLEIDEDKIVAEEEEEEGDDEGNE